LQLYLDSASVESCVVFMPGNNRQRVARPFGRRFVNSEVTHAFTTGNFQSHAGEQARVRMASPSRSLSRNTRAFTTGKIQSGNTRQEQCIRGLSQ
jgi:hypothetical protein